MFKYLDSLSSNRSARQSLVRKLCWLAVVLGLVNLSLVIALAFL